MNFNSKPPISENDQDRRRDRLVVASASGMGRAAWHLGHMRSDANRPLGQAAYRGAGLGSSRRQ